MVDVDGIFVVVVWFFVLFELFCDGLVGLD